MFTLVRQVISGNRLHENTLINFLGMLV